MAARGDVVDLLDDSSDGESDARGIPGVRWFASKSCANDLRRPLPAPLRSAAHSTHGRSNSTKELHNSTSGSARSTSDDGPSGNATTKKSGPRVYPTYDDAVKTALAMVASLDAENGRIASISDSTTSSTSNSNSHHLDPVRTTHCCCCKKQTGRKDESCGGESYSWSEGAHAVVVAIIIIILIIIRIQ
uniref:Uncharacterized protein n=1 Tax=Globisporangium ultimum (strain ATCC 200006 / CBS 805.95 / DAOM BR144) TaxID=431595 RepID=K3WMK8_GLOUD